MSNPSILALVNQFGVKVRTQKKIRGGIYRIATPSGHSFSLKRMPKHAAKLKWIDRALLHVQRSGLLVAWRNPQKPEGRRTYGVSKKGEMFVLTPWISGKQPSPRSLVDMQACGMTLARLHEAGHELLKRDFANNQIGKWYPTLQNRRRYIQKKIGIANQNGFRQPLNLFLKKHGPEIIRYAKQADDLLKRSGYQNCRCSPRTHGVLCHGDGGPSNFILHDEGTYLIDFETLQVNLRAYDLYRIIYNSCKDYKWDFSIAKSILDGYRQIATLNKTDYKLMSVWLRFPLSSYLVLSPFKRIPFTTKRLQWALDSERKISVFLQELNEYAKKHTPDHPEKIEKETWSEAL